MDIQIVLARAAGFLPDAWGEDGRLIAVTAGALALIVLVTGLAASLAERVRGRRARVPAEAVAEQFALPDAVGVVRVRPATATRLYDLDPEEWVAGSVIHLDRHKAAGLIRCDRLKRPVPFRLAAGGGVLPRVGDKVRFKGRHGARRRPVAYVVERAG